MPKIINTYAQPSDLANALRGFVGSFGQNTPQTEYARQKAYELSRGNRYLPLSAEALRKGDTRDAAYYGYLAGQDPKMYAGANRFIAATNNPVDAPVVTQSMLGAGDSFATTPIGVNRAEANRREIENLRTHRQYDAAKYRADQSPTSILADGIPKIVPQSEAYGQRPVLPQSQVRGAILQQDMPNLTPEQRATAGGYAPKNPANIWVGRTADGSLHPTADGKTSLQTGEPIIGPVQKIEGPDAAGLGKNKQALNTLIQSRVSTRTATANIDQLSAALTQPNAGAAVGMLGGGAEIFNNARAQIESAVKLVGGEDSVQAFASQENQQAVGQAINYLFGNPQFNAAAQRLGINAATFRSMFQDLAYAIAKAREPSGRLGVDDIKRAATTIGATLGDPVATRAVLENVKQGLARAQAIREQVMKEVYPEMPDAAGEQAPAAQPDAPSIIQYDSQGNRVQ